MEKDLKVDRFILFFAFKYAMGRKTTAPGIVIDNIIANIKEIPTGDIRDYIEKIGFSYSYGYDDIQDKWLKLMELLKNELEERIISECISIYGYGGRIPYLENDEQNNDVDSSEIASDKNENPEIAGQETDDFGKEIIEMLRHTKIGKLYEQEKQQAVLEVQQQIKQESAVRRAKVLIELGFDNDIVIQKTGLSLDEIVQLRDEKRNEDE